MIGGALVGGISSGSWSGALEGAANGFMMGSITGAISGGIRGGINYARTSPLIRSVSADELNSIKSTGQFSSSGILNLNGLLLILLMLQNGQIGLVSQIMSESVSQNLRSKTFILIQY